MQVKSPAHIVDTVFKGVAVAIGIAVVVLNLFCGMPVSVA